MKIINIQQAHNDYRKKQGIVYADEDIVIIDTIQDLERFKENMVIDNYVFIIVRNGHITVDVNKEKYDIREHDIFSCTPRYVFENAMVSPDFDMFGMLLSPRYLQQLWREASLEVSVSLSQGCSMMHLSDEEMSIIEQYHNIMASNFLKKSSKLRSRTLTHLMQAFALEIYSILRKSPKREPKVTGFSAAEQIFQRFLIMLRESDQPNLTVNEYANRLNITPKYFSTICKQVANRTASSIINEEVVNTARILLRDSSNSIKQVSDALNFANQSHFGTFIRRHTGKSPQQLRDMI